MSTAGCSLGVRPSRVYRQKSCPGSRPDSSHVLTQSRTRRSPPACTSECHSTPAWPHPSPHVKTPARDGTALLGFLRRCAPDRSGAPASGLWVHLMSRRTLLPTGRHSVETGHALPEPLGIA